MEKGTSLLLEALEVGREVTGQQENGNIHEGFFPDLQANVFPGVMAIK